MTTGMVDHFLNPPSTCREECSHQLVRLCREPFNDTLALAHLDPNDGVREPIPVHEDANARCSVVLLHTLPVA